VANLAKVDGDLANAVASWFDVPAPAGGQEAKQTVTFNGKSVDVSPALSMENGPKTSTATRKVAVLVADGVNESDVAAIRSALTPGGAICEVIAKTLTPATGSGGGKIAVDHSAITVDSVQYDAVFVPGGKTGADSLAAMPKALYFIAEAFGHNKPIGAVGEGAAVLKAAILAPVKLSGQGSDGVVSDLGVVTFSGPATGADFSKQFIAAIAQHRFWDRPDQDQVPLV
jgi:catalase